MVCSPEVEGTLYAGIVESGHRGRVISFQFTVVSKKEERRKVVPILGF
jgi:hypothetical protein